MHSPIVSTGTHRHTHRLTGTHLTLFLHQINTSIWWWLTTQRKHIFLLAWLFLVRMCYTFYSTQTSLIFMKSHFCMPNAVRITDVWASYCGCHLRRNVSCPVYWDMNLSQLSRIICPAVHRQTWFNIFWCILNITHLSVLTSSRS